MAFSADAAAFQVQERLKSLHGLIHEIQASREKSEHNLNNITKTQERINQDDRVSNYHQVLYHFSFL
jgi:SAGA-associated factor 29